MIEDGMKLIFSILYILERTGFQKFISYSLFLNYGKFLEELHSLILVTVLKAMIEV